MKKIIIAAAALLLSASSFAQFGIIGGLTSSSSSISTAATELTSGTLNQYHVGITAKWGFGKVFALQPALIYDVKGAKLKDIQGIGDVDCKTGYLELPIMLQIGYDFGKVIRIYGIAAPFFGYAVYNSYDWREGISTNWDNIKNRFEWGAELGGGLELFKHLEINLTYYWNFGDLYGATWEAVTSSKCGGIKLGAAILF